MDKQKKPLENLGKTDKEHLRRMFPWLLQREFRKITKEEITSEKVYRELFPDDEVIEIHKLIAIYEYQR